jgi:hypothetical protein
MTPERLRVYPASHYELQDTTQLYTPRGSKKPDTAVLNSIISDLGLAKDECIYVGDNLFKDVAMALDCGVDDAWAQYGQAHERAEYSLLKQVTHWAPEEVEREARIKAREHVQQTYTLAKSFSEILDVVDFRDFHGEKPKLSDEENNQVIDIWKVVVDVQQHFNDIEMRIRSMFVTILLALFASIGFLLDKKLSFPIGPMSVQFAVLIPIIGIVGTFLFYFIYRFWYHRLLV